MLSDMMIKIQEMIAVQVYQFAADETFQVEMLMAVFFLVDELIAGTGFAVEGIFSDGAGFDEFIQLAVDSSNAQVGAFGSKISADLLDVSMFVFIFNEIIEELFFLFSIIT